MTVDIDVTKLSDSLYSYQHLKAFGNANHLYLDPWNSDTVWFVSHTWTIQRASIQAFNCFIKFLSCFFPVNKEAVLLWKHHFFFYEMWTIYALCSRLASVFRQISHEASKPDLRFLGLMFVFF